MNTHAPTSLSSVARLLRGVTILLIGLLAAMPIDAGSATGSGHFPLYPVIQDNVAFWKDVYTKYSRNQAVIHDKNDLSIVYEVVDKLDRNLPGAEKANTLLLERKTREYRELLTRLSRSAPVSSREKRVAAMFAGKNAARRMAIAAEAIRVQTGMKERFREGVVRSGAYISEIKQIFRSYSLPEDLAYLPHVESSFDTSAFSKVGASGIWQFTKSTGKSYLRIDRAVDERSDPILAAHAAAKYLKNSYDQLGTWPLALTSYNYGTAGMKRAVNEKGSYERIFTEYEKGHFKFASRNFYSEFLAALASAKELEQQPSIRLDRPEPSRTVTLKKSAGIREIRKHYGVSKSALERLNPALRPDVFSGARNVPKGYALRLPASRQADQPVIAAREKKTPAKNGATAAVHQVRPGENLTTIARQHGLSPQSLAKANGIDGSVIRVGQKLHIPARTTSVTSAAAAETDKKSISRLAVYKTTVHNGKRYGKIQVQPGESLRLLAQWTATPPVVLQRLNNLKAGKVQPGKHLVLVFDKVSVDFFHKKRKQFHTRDQKDEAAVTRTTG